MRKIPSKLRKIRRFDPNGPGQFPDHLFGLPFTPVEADIVVIPVPWQVTVSYRAGTAQGPEAVLQASSQVDLYDALFPDLWKTGIALDEIPSELARVGRKLREKAERYLERLASGRDLSADRELSMNLQAINAGCALMNESIRTRARTWLQQGKLVAVLGGDHSTPLGLIQALAERVGPLGILQIDAHADLRNAYEGFEFSHASIMFNALKLSSVTRLVQVGIRDYCQDEVRVVRGARERIKCFYDRDLKRRQWQGESWDAVCTAIVRELPPQVYLSFDIDGLDPKLCPHTGTPVPGGLEFEQACHLVGRVVLAGKRIVGFDLNEVAPGTDEWDGNVGARLLYRLAGYAAYSNKLTKKARA